MTAAKLVSLGPGTLVLPRRPLPVLNSMPADPLDLNATNGVRLAPYQPIVQNQGNLAGISRAAVTFLVLRGKQEVDRLLHLPNRQTAAHPGRRGPLLFVGGGEKSVVDGAERAVATDILTYVRR